MIPTFLLVLLIAQDPSIGDVRTLTEGYARSGCWLPLKVRVHGPGGTDARLTATADAGFRVTRPLRIPASGTADVVIPVVVVSENAKVDVVLQAAGREVTQRLMGKLRFLTRDRLVLVDPRHPEFDSLRAQEIPLPKEPAFVRFASSDPADCNEAAEMGALEIADAVITTEERQTELTMGAWRALSGGTTTGSREVAMVLVRMPLMR